MIGFLKGTLKETRTSGDSVLLVEQSNGCAIGYQVLVANRLDRLSEKIGQPTELYVHTHLREGAIELFGFLTIDEKVLFQTLIQVSGIGPKAAHGLLSQAAVGDLVRAILNEEKAFLTSLSGIGKKTAERIILDTKDGLERQIESGQFGSSLGKESYVAGHSGGRVNPVHTPQWEEAKQALTGLGFKESELLSVYSRLNEEGLLEQEPEKLVKDALGRLRDVTRR